ncbi:ATP-binding protein [Pedobacter borealis]|uniref:ATP-binding protein n=1 Tax=Pedobacter borealis TaxID=475254 RepID=UPI000492FC66|nr:AAA family ATPase [Pedobacter borealis]
MDKLKEKSNILLSQQNLSFQRYLLSEINWSNRLICILGSRGTGKTTTLLQRMKLAGVEEALYITLDDIYFTSKTLIETAENFRQQGGKYLYIDEVHKYPGWAREIKNIYDFYKDINLIITGSSIIEMLSLEVDLSRRARVYELNGLSFREFLAYNQNVICPVMSLEDVLKNHITIASDLNSIKPLKAYKEYCSYGYYPFFKEDPEGYFIQLTQVVNLIIGYDLSSIQTLDKQQIRKTYQLLGILAAQVPFKPNITSLANTLEMSRSTLILYLHYLEKAKLIQQIFLEGKGMGAMEKPSKLLLDNTNLFDALSTSPANEGSRRECFFVNQLKNAGHQVSLAKAGDFKIDGKYTFEVGGAKKKFNQIAGLENSFIAADDIEIGSGNKIPLWTLGLLY